MSRALMRRWCTCISCFHSLPSLAHTHPRTHACSNVHAALGSLGHIPTHAAAAATHPQSSSCVTQRPRPCAGRGCGTAAGGGASVGCPSVAVGASRGPPVHQWRRCVGHLCRIKARGGGGKRGRTGGVGIEMCTHPHPRPTTASQLDPTHLPPHHPCPHTHGPAAATHCVAPRPRAATRPVPPRGRTRPQTDAAAAGHAGPAKCCAPPSPVMMLPPASPGRRRSLRPVLSFAAERESVSADRTSTRTTMYTSHTVTYNTHPNTYLHHPFGPPFCCGHISEEHQRQVPKAAVIRCDRLCSIRWMDA